MESLLQGRPQHPAALGQRHISVPGAFLGTVSGPVLGPFLGLVSKQLPAPSPPPPQLPALPPIPTAVLGTL